MNGVAKPAKAPVSSTKKTEGGHCAGCLTASVENPVRNAADKIKEISTIGRGPMCISSKLISSAKFVINKNYGGRTRGKGLCAIAVRQSLNKAQIWSGGGIGDAKDMMPGLKKMGFKNVITRGMSPDTAPAGSILVYGGTKASGCRGLGAQFGHIEIKENQNSYLYDGKVTKHIQAAYGSKCRPLIGVMVMGSECPTCSEKTKKECGV